MNIERLRLAQDWLRGEIEGPWFDMAHYVEAGPAAKNWCQTACCIAGWACSQTQDFEGFSARHSALRAFSTGRDYFDLTEEQANELFLPGPRIVLFATREQAHRAIETLILTGTPDWSIQDV